MNGEGPPLRTLPRLVVPCLGLLGMADDACLDEGRFAALNCRYCLSIVPAGFCFCPKNVDNRRVGMSRLAGAFSRSHDTPAGGAGHGDGGSRAQLVFRGGPRLGQEKCRCHRAHRRVVNGLGNGLLPCARVIPAGQRCLRGIS